MQLARFLIPATLLACSGRFSSKADDDTGGATTENGDVDLPDGIDDPTADLDEGGCEDYDGTPIAGAASYFVGVYTLEDADTGSWSGTEQWLLFANETWVEAGGYDCTVTWYAQAVEGSTGSCAACDLGLSVSLTVDESRTDCPDGLWESEANGDVNYGVIRGSGGESQWYFADSGTWFASGEYTDTALSFITEKSCDWF